MPQLCKGTLVKVSVRPKTQQFQTHSTNVRKKLQKSGSWWKTGRGNFQRLGVQAQFISTTYLTIHIYQNISNNSYLTMLVCSWGYPTTTPEYKIWARDKIKISLLNFQPLLTSTICRSIWPSLFHTIIWKPHQNASKRNLCNAAQYN